MFVIEEKDMGLDHDAFEQIWDKIIRPEIGEYQKDFNPEKGALKSLRLALVQVPRIKELIWERYRFYNITCKSEYMEPPTSGKPFLLDRHKVAACYTAAIVSVQPMHLFSNKSALPEKYPINELLALTTGLSILRAYLMAENLPEDEKRHAENGILYPPESMVSHGDYVNNFANELHFAYLDGNINILSIAHELFLLEVITRAGIGGLGTYTS